MKNSLKTFTLTSVKNIQRAIENNNLIIFVGAGVSKNSGIPTWADVIEELANELGICACTKDYNGKNIFSNDEYLKIPQYYYNERGPKEYYDKIQKILNKDVKPNEIHRIIFELNPRHIITTNYDNLIEQQERIQKRKKYSKVATNKELANIKTNNLIIKMHGEFDNIVLKESDYDSYSNNFKLIETYIKGLFTTEVILFVGFSAEDPNIRKIRQWIKDILGDKYQPAYLIDVNAYDNVNEEEFRIKTEYFKHQGIYKLYYSQLEDEIEEIFKTNKEEINLKNQGLELYKFLYFLKNYKNNNITKYYNDLKHLECVNVITRDLLSKVFGVDIIVRQNNGAFLFENSQQTFNIDLLRCKKVLTQEDKIKENLHLLYCNSILNKEDTEFVSSQIHNSNSFYHTGKILHKKELQPYQNILSFLKNKYPLLDDEYPKIKYIFQVIEQAISYEKGLCENTFINNLTHYTYDISDIMVKENSIDIFKKPYVLYKTNKLIEAYKSLEQISIEYSDSPLLFYLSEFNRKIIAKSIKVQSCHEATKEEQRISEEYNKIDLELIKKDKLPLSIKECSTCFTIDYLSKSAIELIRLCEKIHQTKDIVEKGGSSIDSDINQLYSKFYKFWNFTANNFLFIDNYSDIKDVYFNFIKAILISYSIDESICNGGSSFQTNKVVDFDYFDIFIMIEYIEPKTLLQLIKRYNIKEFRLNNQNLNTKQELLNAFTSIIDRAIEGMDFCIVNKIEVFLIIFSLVELSTDEIVYIIKKYIELSEKYNAKTISFANFRNNKLRILREFVVNLYNKYRDTSTKININLIEEIIIKYKDTINFYNADKDYFSLIRNCLLIISDSKTNKYKLNSQIINFYIHESRNYDSIYKLLILIYSLTDANYKNKIKRIIKEKVTELQPDNVEIFSEAIKYGIIKLTQKKENLLLKILNNEIENKKNVGNSQEKFVDNISIMLYIILDLLICDKWIQIEKLNNLISNLYQILELYRIKANRQNIERAINIFQLYIDLKKCNFKDIDILDFTQLNDKKIKILKKIIQSDINVKKIIINKFIDNISIPSYPHDNEIIKEFMRNILI